MVFLGHHIPKLTQKLRSHNHPLVILSFELLHSGIYLPNPSYPILDYVLKHYHWFGNDHRNFVGRLLVHYLIELFLILCVLLNSH